MIYWCIYHFWDERLHAYLISSKNAGFCKMYRNLVVEMQHFVAKYGMQLDAVRNPLNMSFSRQLSPSRHGSLPILMVILHNNDIGIEKCWYHGSNKNEISRLHDSIEILPNTVCKYTWHNRHKFTAEYIGAIYIWSLGGLSALAVFSVVSSRKIHCFHSMNRSLHYTKRTPVYLHVLQLY